jgi:hypothetical protein
MAGPYILNPGDTQFNIPTKSVFENTTVKVENSTPFDGGFSMTAGGSPTEFNPAPPLRVTTVVRNFGGVLLAIKNESKQPSKTLAAPTLKVWTD